MRGKKQQGNDEREETKSTKTGYILLMSQHSVLMVPQGRICHNVFSVEKPKRV